MQSEPLLKKTDVSDEAPETPAALRASLKKLRTQIRSSTFILKLAVCVLLTAGGVVLVLQPSVWLRILGTFVLGYMFAHAVELQHQALHNIGFRKQRANTVAGVVLGLPMLISFAAYQTSHLRHHKHLGTPRNREFFDYGDQYGTDSHRSKASVAWSWLTRFSLALHYRQFLVNLVRVVRRLDFDGETATTSRRIRRDYYIMLATIILLGAASIVTGQALIFWLWLIPLVFVAGPVHAVIELPEHFRCETLDLDPFANSRTIRSNWLVSWFTNGNNFHVEHHLMPNLPIERLPDLHAEVRDRLQHFNSGYFDYFYRLIRKEPRPRHRLEREPAMSHISSG